MSSTNTNINIGEPEVKNSAFRIIVITFSILIFLILLMLFLTMLYTINNGMLVYGAVYGGGIQSAKSNHRHPLIPILHHKNPNPKIPPIPPPHIKP
jgi:hypothetical protein